MNSGKTILKDVINSASPGFVAKTHLQKFLWVLPSVKFYFPFTIPPFIILVKNGCIEHKAISNCSQCS